MAHHLPAHGSNHYRASRQNYLELPRHSFILCASLVHNPANLGGLCRLAEVFRLESVVLPDLAIAQHATFRKTAVSAHHWQPLSECSVDQLSQWFDTHRKQNYQIIGLDTNHASDTVTTFPFPKQTILLLGQELTGIPLQILRQCDRVVTIPQYGLVESLNVQQAGAIAIYEYLKQHPLSSSQPTEE